MSSPQKDGYAGFSFFNALPADVYAAAVAGTTIDLQGFDEATIILNAQSLASGGAMSADNVWRGVLQQGLASAAGVSAWSNVAHSMMLHSVIGLNGPYSVLSDGIFASFGSTTDVLSNATYAVGYKGDGKHRYLRLYMSNTGVASTLWMAAIAVLGKPANWPINEVAKA